MNIIQEALRELSLEEYKEAKKKTVCAILNKYSDEYNSNISAKSLRDAVVKCINDHIDEIIPGEGEKAIRNLNNCRYDSQILSTIGTYLTTIKVEELEEKGDKKSKKLPFIDLFDQVYCSLTDGGENKVYKALGKLNGKAHYNVDELNTQINIKPEVNAIVVTSDNFEWAEHIADVYELEVEKNEDKGIIKILIPDNAPVKEELLILEDLNIKESVESSMPVQILPHDEVYNYIEEIPVATATVPPKFFQVGYIKELGSQIPSKFRGGRGSEGQPNVRIFKCSEMTVYTGADYENLKATKDMRKETGKERSGERTGFSFEPEGSLENKIGISSKGEEQLQCYIKKGTYPKAKYFISLDDEDLREASRDEVAEYLTPAQANIILNGKPETEGPQGQKIIRLKLSGIYRIGNLGQSIIR